MPITYSQEETRTCRGIMKLVTDPSDYDAGRVADRKDYIVDQERMEDLEAWLQQVNAVAYDSAFGLNDLPAEPEGSLLVCPVGVEYGPLYQPQPFDLSNAGPGNCNARAWVGLMVEEYIVDTRVEDVSVIHVAADGTMGWCGSMDLATVAEAASEKLLEEDEDEDEDE